MRKSSVLSVLLVALAWFAGMGVAAAQGPVRLTVDGLEPNTEVVVVLAFANMNKTEPTVTTGGGGSLDFISDFANMGKTASAAEDPTRVYVYYDRCQDPYQILFSDTPRDDEDCRDPIGIFFMSSRTTEVNVNVETGTIEPDPPGDSSPPSGGRPPSSGGTPPRGRVNIGGGIENVDNRTAMFSPSQDLFEGPVGTLDTNEWSGNFFFEYFPIRWVGGGYGYESAGAATLNEVFTAEPPFEDFTVTFDTIFDPSVHNIYAAAQFPFGMVRPFIHVGASRFTADSGGTRVLRENDVELDRETISQTNSGWGPHVAVGVDIFANSWLGVRTGVTYEKLTDDSVAEDEGTVDEELLKFMINAIMSF